MSYFDKKNKLQMYTLHHIKDGDTIILFIMHEYDAKWTSLLASDSLFAYKVLEIRTHQNIGFRGGIRARLASAPPI